jgi:hypothetical protein
MRKILTISADLFVGPLIVVSGRVYVAGGTHYADSGTFSLLYVMGSLFATIFVLKNGTAIYSWLFNC